MIDITPWKTNDLEWKKNRDEYWSIFERWLIKNYSASEDLFVDRCLKNAKNFYDNGILDKSIEGNFVEAVGFRPALALHPKICDSSIRELMAFEGFKNQHLKGHFASYYLMKPRYISLIEQTALPQNFILALLKGFYGNTLAEAAEILEFEPRSQAFHVVYDLGAKLFLFAADGEGEYINHEIASYMLPFFLGALPLLSEEDAEKCTSRFKAFVKVKVREFDSGAITDPQGREFMEKILKGIKSCWGNLNPLVQEKLSPLVE